MVMEFKIQEKKVSFSDDQIEVAKILKRYHKLASEGKEIAKILLIARKFTPIEFIKNGNSFAMAIINSYREHVIQDFINKGFFSYDESKLKDDFDDTYDFDEEWEKLIAPMVEIISKNEDTQLYRELRKEGRGRAIGGGFGIEGALKGFVTAGAINMATDIGHSIFNSIANAIDETTQEKQLRELFDDFFIDKYLIIIYDGIYSFGKIFVKKLVEYDFLEPDALGNSFDEEKQKEYLSIFFNLLKNRIPESERVNVALHLIKNSPYENGEYYEYLNEIVKDHDADQVVAMKQMMHARNNTYAISDFSRDNVKPTEFDIAIGKKIEQTYGIRIPILFEGKKALPAAQKISNNSNAPKQEKNSNAVQKKNEVSMLTINHGFAWFVAIAIGVAIALLRYDHSILSNLCLFGAMFLVLFVLGIGLLSSLDIWEQATNQKETTLMQMSKNADSIFYIKASGGSFFQTLLSLAMFGAFIYVCKINFFSITFWFMVAGALSNLLILFLLLYLGIKKAGKDTKQPGK